MYLLDANIFIDANNRYYAMDIAPGFWTWLKLAHQQGLVFTVRAVAQEILPGDDLGTWFQKLPSGFVHDPTAADAPNLTALAVWAQTSTHYRPDAIAEFLSSADYRLVAQAKTLDFTVVTHETPDPNIKKRIKIPEACAHLGVPYLNPFQVMRTHQVRLTL